MTYRDPETGAEICPQAESLPLFEASGLSSNLSAAQCEMDGAVAGARIPSLCMTISILPERKSIVRSKEEREEMEYSSERIDFEMRLQYHGMAEYNGDEA